MAEPRGPSVAELERALTSLGERVDYPEGIGLAQAVVRRLEQGPVPVRAPRRRRRLVLAVAIGLLLLTAAAVAAVLRVGGIELRPAPTPPATPTTPAPTQTTTPPPDEITELPVGLGPEVSLEEADAAVDFRILVPGALGEPDAIHLNRQVPGGMVSFVYLPRPGLPEIGDSGAAVVVTQFGGLVQGVKEFESDHPPMPVDVHGNEGFYVEGFHTFLFLDDEGDRRVVMGRRVGSTLIWQEAGAVIRVESDLPLARVVEVAESMR
jgi:hypothetical protein